MPTHPLPPAPSGVDASRWAQTVASVREYCGWHIAPEVDEEVTVDGSGCAVQMLPTLRLVNLISITNDGAAVSNPEWSAAGFVRGSWTCRLRGVTATMRHGYEDWPADLLGVLVELATDDQKARVSQVTNRAYQVSFDTDAETEQRRNVFDRYRLSDLQ